MLISTVLHLHAVSNGPIYITARSLAGDISHRRIQSTKRVDCKRLQLSMDSR